MKGSIEKWCTIVRQMNIRRIVRWKKNYDLHLESNYIKHNNEKCVIVGIKLREANEHKMKTTKIDGFGRRNNEKPCKCVDTFNSTATTFSKTAVCLTKQRDRIRWLLFLRMRSFDSKNCGFHLFLDLTNEQRIVIRKWGLIQRLGSPENGMEYRSLKQINYVKKNCMYM